MDIIVILTRDDRILAGINALAIYGGLALLWTTLRSSIRFAKKAWSSSLKQAWLRQRIQARKHYAIMLDYPSYMISQLFLKSILGILGFFGLFGIGVISSMRTVVHQPPNIVQREAMIWSGYIFFPLLAFGMIRTLLIMAGINNAAYRRGKRTRLLGRTARVFDPHSH